MVSKLLLSLFELYLIWSLEAQRVWAITEDDNEISLRDANSSRERPKLEGFDMDSDVVQEIEVRIFAPP